MTVRIGVLGGIGPEATGEFYSKLIRKFQERGLIRSNADFPQIIVNSIPAPELIGEITDEELKHYIDGLKQLDSFGVDFIVMVCNTIHLHYDDLQKHVKSPILDLREALKQELIGRKMKSVLIIGTPSTVKKGLYRFKGIRSFEPDSDEMTELAESIFEFNKGVDKELQVTKARNICRKYLKLGAETVILGCTEFAVMLDKENFPKINTVDVLVEATIDKVR